MSVITTRRAYEDLENSGYILSIVGKGTYVAKQDPEILRQKQLLEINENIKKIIAKSKLIGLSLDDLQTLIKESYEEEN